MPWRLSRSIASSGVSSLPWTDRPVCRGPGVRFALDWLSSLPWTQRPVWSGKRTEFKETTKRTLTTDIPAIIKVIEESAVAMVARLADATRREEEWRAQQREETRRRLEEEDRRKIAQSNKDSHEQLTQVISAWSKAVALESFFRGVEERATLLSGNETLAVLDRLKLAREFVGSHDPLEFFLRWKTPLELYVPMSMRAETQPISDAGNMDEDP